MRLHEDEGIETARADASGSGEEHTDTTAKISMAPGGRPPVEALGRMISDLEARLGLGKQVSVNDAEAQALKEASSRLSRLAEELTGRSSEPLLPCNDPRTPRSARNTTLTVGHETVAVEDVASAVAHACYASEIKSAGVRLRIDRSLPLVRIDRRDLEKVLFVLIGAALDRVGKRRAPEIHIGAARNDEGYVVWVADNGLSRDICSFPQRAVTAIEALVARWGGRAWTDPHSGPETSVFFTLPSNTQASESAQAVSVES